MKVRRFIQVMKESFLCWQEDNCAQMGAALSYYSIFAMAPLLLLSIAIAGFVFGMEAAQGEIMGQLSDLFGAQSATTVQNLIEAARKPMTGVFATIVSVATFFVGASAIVVELKNALNRIWRSHDSASGIWSFLKNRLISMAMVLGIGFLLLISLIVSALLAAVGKFLNGWLPLPETVLQAINFVVSFSVITVLFAMLYKFLPDVRIRWRDVWVGAAVTSFLFSVGKYLIGVYIGKSSIGSTYGAAGSFIVLLVWVYYSTQIFYWGAEFTKVNSGRANDANEKGRGADARSAPLKKEPAFIGI